MKRREIFKALAAVGLSVAYPIELARALPLDVGERTPNLVGRSSTLVPTAREFTIRPTQIPYIVRQLVRKGTDASWIVFMFETSVASAETGDRILNLQYSVEGEVVGLDWVLLGERNMADESDIARLGEAYKYRVLEREVNGVPFLRVENGNICELGQRIVKDVYRIADDTPIGLLVDGFSL